MALRPAMAYREDAMKRAVPVAPAGDALYGRVGVGHMYNLVVPVHLPSLADALFFVPRGTPMQGS